MGHDIEIREGGSSGYVQTETNICGNWWRFRNYFHIDTIHGHPGRLVARRLREALAQLAKDGFTPNANMRVDDGGNSKDPSVAAWQDPDYKKDQKCMFAHHLQNFLALAEKYPDGYWYSDQVWYSEPLYGVEPTLGSDDSDDESDESSDDQTGDAAADAVVVDDPPPGITGLRTKDGMVYPFRHPVRGNMTVNTFGDAMEVYRVMVETDNPLAQSLHDLAFKLPF